MSQPSHQRLGKYAVMKTFIIERKNWKPAFIANHIVEPAASRFTPPMPRYENGGKGMPPARINRESHPTGNPSFRDFAKRFFAAAAGSAPAAPSKFPANILAIAIETYDLNLEE